jgi:hypothetical protein
MGKMIPLISYTGIGVNNISPYFIPYQHDLHPLYKLGEAGIASPNSSRTV